MGTLVCHTGIMWGDKELITEGKEYKVVGKLEEGYLIINNEGVTHLFTLGKEDKSYYRLWFTKKE